jgi:hypothetical protein
VFTDAVDNFVETFGKNRASGLAVKDLRDPANL